MDAGRTGRCARLRVTRAFAIAAGLSMWIGVGTATAGEEPRLATGEKAVLGAQKLQRMLDPSLSSPVSSPAPVFKITSTTKDTTVSAKAGLQWGIASFDAIISGPLKKNATSELADLDGLRNKATLDLGVGLSRWPDEVPRVARACQELAFRQNRSVDKDCTIQTIRDAEKTRVQAGGSQGESLVRFIDAPPRYFATVRYKVSREDFDYLDSTTLASAPTEKHVSSAVTAAAAWLSESDWLVAASLQHQDVFAAAASTQVCRRLTPDVSKCADAVIGGPTQKTSDTAQLEVRGFISTRVAISPRVTRNIRKNVTEFALPVYFITKQVDRRAAASAGDPGLVGGVDLRWKAGQSWPTLTVFVGQAFTTKVKKS